MTHFSWHAYMYKQDTNHQNLTHHKHTKVQSNFHMTSSWKKYENEESNFTECFIKFSGTVGTFFNVTQIPNINSHLHLAHWGRVTRICVSKLIIIGSGNGLSPGRRQAIIWTNAGLLLIGDLGTNFSEILIKIYTLSFKKMHLKMSSGKWRPSCLGLNVLKQKILPGTLDTQNILSSNFHHIFHHHNPQKPKIFTYHFSQNIFFSTQAHQQSYKLSIFQHDIPYKKYIFQHDNPYKMYFPVW